MNAKDLLHERFLLPLFVSLLALGAIWVYRSQHRPPVPVRWNPAGIEANVIVPDRRDREVLLVTTAAGGTVVSINAHGKVTFGPGMTPDQASREFWQRLGTVWKDHCK